MGAQEDSYFAETTETDHRKVFSEVREELAYEFGSGGYSGTLAEKHSVKLLSGNYTRNEANSLADEDFDNDRLDKWGPAKMCRVVDTTESEPKQVGWFIWGLCSS